MRVPVHGAAVWATLLAAAAVGTAAPPPGDDFIAPLPRERLSAPAMAALASIRARQLAAHVRFLASPALEGRGLGGHGLDAAAEYAAAGLAGAGVAPPSAGGSYFQEVPLREITENGGDLSVETSAGARTSSRSFVSGTDCAFPQVVPQTLAAPVAFAGYGIREVALGRDDYSELDVRGKAVLVLGGLPAGAPWQRAELVARYGSATPRERWQSKVAAARAAGAAMVLGVDDDIAAPAGEETQGGRFFLPEDAPPAEEAPLLRISAAVEGALLAPARLSPDLARVAAPRDLDGVRVTARVTGREHALTSRNVIGVLPGSDPRLREEAVVVGAHIDHLGTAGGVTYPGADDNASGAAALIEIARAFAAMAQPPRRTVVFAFWTGEEEGKLGSGFFVRHPLWPLRRITAYVNLDMIGHPWSAAEIAKLAADAGLPDSAALLARTTPADFAEPGLPADAPQLESALRRAARVTGMALHLDRTDGTSGGSDYRDFARAHVPFVRFFGNFFPAYHEPGDTSGTLDAAQVERMARLAFATAWLLADAPDA